MKIAEQVITKTYVLESLRHGDLSTGRKIIDNIKDKRSDIKADYKIVSLRNDMFSYLKMIALDAVVEDGILLFIEVHGDVNGLDIGSESATWDELTIYLQAINEASRMGLVVIFSCCFGVYYFRQTSITGRAPYYVMFGVDKSISENKLLKVNEELVYGFFNSSELTGLVSVCNQALHIHDINLSYLEAGKMFVNAFNNYIKNECRSDSLESRSRECYKMLQELDVPTNINYADFKTKYIDFVLNRENCEEKYNEIRDRFLMTDIDGGLYERFHIDFDEMYEKAGIKNLFKSAIELNN